ncbi:hypothetical protein [Xanthomarina gelatinilytica]|uniref:hypothetical protein n=1 Tax=Xanthomarina gelatinilytica TaxID=1137281 RepID=UPI003AA89842
MKHLLYLVVIFLLPFFSIAQQNEAKSKAFYFSAQDAFKSKKYDDALNLLDKSIEAGGASNAYIEALKAKCYAGKKDWVNTKQALEVCYMYSPGDDVLKDLSPIILQADTEYEKAIKAEQDRILAEQNRQLAEQQAEMVRLQKESEKELERIKLQEKTRQAELARIEETKKLQLAEGKIEALTSKAESVQIIDCRLPEKTVQHRILSYSDGTQSLIDQYGEVLIPPTSNTIELLENTYLYAIVRSKVETNKGIVELKNVKLKNRVLSFMLGEEQEVNDTPEEMTLEANIFDPIINETYGDNHISITLNKKLKDNYIIVTDLQTTKNSIFYTYKISDAMPLEYYKTPFMCDKIIECYGDLLLVFENNGLQGVVNHKSEILIPFNYKQIKSYKLSLPVGKYKGEWDERYFFGQTLSNPDVWQMFDEDGKYIYDCKDTDDGYEKI